MAPLVLKTLSLLLSQWNYHLNCNNLIMVLLSGPSKSFLGVIFRFSDWSMIPNCMILFGVKYTLTIGRVGMNVIPAVLRVVAWWAVVCGGFVMWPVWCVMVGSVTVSSVCWTGPPWAASMAAEPVLLLWSGVASVQVMTAGTAVSTVPRLWSGLVSSFLVFPVVSRTWSGVTVSVCLVVWHWCSWRGYPVRAVHDKSIFITFMISGVRAVSCNMSWFLALETLVFHIWHHVDHWR